MIDGELDDPIDLRGEHAWKFRPAGPLFDVGQEHVTVPMLDADEIPFEAVALFRLDEYSFTQQLVVELGCERYRAPPLCGIQICHLWPQP